MLAPGCRSAWGPGADRRANTLISTFCEGSTFGADSHSTIYGNWRRQNGVLNNVLYRGELHWNRQHFIKDPDTGKRQARMNPEEEWIIESVPHLRIVSDELWSLVKQRQDETRSQITKDKKGIRSEQARRPSYLLSGLLKCGVCGGGYSKINRHSYGCSRAKDRGICSNDLTIRREQVETLALDGLRHQLMHPDCVKAFVAEYHREWNRLAASQEADRGRDQSELAQIKRSLHQLIEAIKAGVPGMSVKDEIAQLEKRRSEVEAKLQSAPKPAPRFHPNLSELYRRKVDDLANALNEEGTKVEASEAIRALIEEIRLVPVEGALKIELYGELAALFALAANETPGIKHPRSGTSGVQITLVAGT